MSDANEPQSERRSIHRELDQLSRLTVARSTFGLDPATYWLAVSDWCANLSISTGKQLELGQTALGSLIDLMGAAVGHYSEKADEHGGNFASGLWNLPPYCFYREAFLAAEEFWKVATTDVPGLSKDNELRARFLVHQACTALSPANFLTTNPEALSRAITTNGGSLLNGQRNAVNVLGASEDKNLFNVLDQRIGVSLAATPGKVVFRNHLIELIQYKPTTKAVHPEPVMIVPAWIMKYYILDLSPKNSMVKWLVDQGYTVYMLSWRNPDQEDASLGFSDYLEQGPRAALNYISGAVGAQKIHAVGYCLGGTLLSILAAELARNDDDRLATLSLIASQLDFSDPGELGIFISEGQVSLLESMMNDHGTLAGSQMSGAFSMIRSNELIWSRYIHEVLMGDPPEYSDLYLWSHDLTRMPAKMHSEYLRQMYLENQLAKGLFTVHGKSVSLHDITLPVFAVGTETDHIAPWKSVYRVGELTSGEVTFSLTSGGHNAGVISEPGHPHRHHRLNTQQAGSHLLDPQTWYDSATEIEGSWWSSWVNWLKEKSSSQDAETRLQRSPKNDPDTYDAPGKFILQR